MVLCPATRRRLDLRSSSRPAAAAEPLVGTDIDNKYRIHRLIGAGGMGCVYDAENLWLGRRVAIKVIRGARSDEALARLRREAQLVAATQHPNICDIYDVGLLADGSPYLVLERLVGETLAGRLGRERQLSVGVTFEIFSQLLSALTAAHQARIVHRDLKPENVFLAHRVGCPAHVKLLDFGFAKDISGLRGHVITRPGSALGTPRYMAPEQLIGDAVDNRTDLFAVGIMLFECLAGAHPFHADTRVDLQSNILRAHPMPLRRFRPELPAELDWLLGKALAKRPDERFASAKELQQALAAVSPPPLEVLYDDDDDEPVSDTVPMRIDQPRPNATPPSSP
jgi:eukaryotic-like serine/threonine-protein kinase